MFIYFLKIIACNLCLQRSYTHTRTFNHNVFSGLSAKKKKIGASVYTLSMVRNPMGWLAATQIREFSHYVSRQITAL